MKLIKRPKPLDLLHKKVTLVRLDRLGDLILSLPVDQMRVFGRSKVAWVVSEGLEFVAQQARPPRDVWAWPKRVSLLGFYRLLSKVRAQKNDVVIIFHAPWWVSLLFWMANVPWRIGVKSQWHSYLFFNKAIRQKRSQALYHESEYNGRLVADGLGIDFDVSQMGPLTLQTPAISPHAPYLVVHPGMGGSARNWPSSYYAKLIQRLSEDMPVVLTASPAEQEVLKAVLKHLSGSHPQIKSRILQTPQEWMEVLGGARAVVAPSTGTIHVASSLGIPVVGIYSPVRVQAPKRWGPLGARAMTVVPEVECPGHMECLMEKCARFDCMKDIDVDTVYEKVKLCLSN